MKEQRAALLKQARQHYVRSYRLDLGIPETYAMYGKSFLAPGEDPARGLPFADGPAGVGISGDHLEGVDLIPASEIIGYRAPQTGGLGPGMPWCVS